MKNKENKFKEILSQHEDLLLRVCRYYAADENDMKDIYQEVLINIWNSLNSFKGKSSLKTWLYRVCVNTSISFVRKDLKHKKLFIQHNDNLYSQLLDDDEVQSEKEKRFLLLEEKINQLNIIDKILITLTLESLPYKEIADITGISEPNVRVRIHRIKKDLRKEFTKH